MSPFPSDLSAPWMIPAAQALLPPGAAPDCTAASLSLAQEATHLGDLVSRFSATGVAMERPAARNVRAPAAPARSPTITTRRTGSSMAALAHQPDPEGWEEF